MLRAMSRQMVVLALLLPISTPIWALGDGDLYSRVSRLEQVLDNRAQLQTLERIDALEQELRQLRGQIELANRDLKQLSDRQRTLYRDIDRRLSSIDAKSLATGVTTPTTSGVSVGADAASITLNEKGLYDSAYALLKDKKLDNSLAAFSRVIERFPSGQYAANAHYWSGEIYLVKEQPIKAQEAFLRVIRLFPLSAKAADSLLKLGYAYLAQGEQAKAEQTFRQVTKQYQGTTLERLANQRLAEIERAP